MPGAIDGVVAAHVPAVDRAGKLKQHPNRSTSRRRWKPLYSLVCVLLRTIRWQFDNLPRDRALCSAIQQFRQGVCLMYTDTFVCSVWQCVLNGPLVALTACIYPLHADTCANIVYTIRTFAAGGVRLRQRGTWCVAAQTRATAGNNSRTRKS